MELSEIFAGVGSSSVGLGAIVWYAKNRFLKFDKKISHMANELREATAENNLQKDQIERLREDIREMRRDYRDLKNKLL